MANSTEDITPFNHVIDFMDGDKSVEVIDYQRQSFIFIVNTTLHVLGLILNSIIFIIYFRHRTMRKVLDTYILNMTIADTIKIIIFFPASISFKTHNWFYGEFLCKLTTLIYVMFNVISSLMLVAIGFEIFRPVKNRKTMFTAIVISAIWIFSCLFSVPSYNGAYVFMEKISSNNKDHLVSYCLYEDDFVVRILDAIIEYILPLISLMIFYILLKSNCSNQKVGEKSKSSSLLLAFLIFLLLCKLPARVHMLIDIFFPEIISGYHNIDTYISYLTDILINIHTCFKPLILYLFSISYRNHIHRYLCFCCFSPGQGYKHENSSSSEDGFELSTNNPRV